MGRVKRLEVGGMVYHALNRANFRSALFKKDAHCEDFLDVVKESLSLVPMRILAYCLMPNHWHMVLYPRADGDLSKGGETVSGTCEEIHIQTKASRAQTQRRGVDKENKPVMLFEPLRLCISARDCQFLHTFPTPFPPTPFPTRRCSNKKVRIAQILLDKFVDSCSLLLEV